jgi:excisionase family DNA binding protein
MKTSALAAVPVGSPGTDPEGPEWMRVEAVARLLDISVGLVYGLVRQGDLAPARKFGRILRIHRSALLP